MLNRISNWYRSLLVHDEGLHALLVILVIIIFIIYPLQARGLSDLMLTKIFLTVLTAAGVWAVSKNRKQLAIVVAISVMNLAFQWYRTVSQESWVIISSLVLTFAFEAILAIFILLRTLAPGPVNLFRIEGSVVVYLLIGVLFATLYSLIFAIDSTAFNIPNHPQNLESWQATFMYFSFITLTTIGYGDIQPALPLAQSAAMMEGLIGQLFPAILIARLVSQSLQETKSS